VKKSRPSVKRVRKKPTEKLEKHNRGKKPITSDVEGLEERAARKDGTLFSFWAHILFCGTVYHFHGTDSI
jgi:hypothetical protein